MNRTVQVALCLVGAVAFVALVVGLAGGSRWAMRLFLLGLGVAAVHLAVIVLIRHLVNGVTG